MDSTNGSGASSTMVDGFSLDIQRFEETVKSMDASRHNMYNAIVTLKKVKDELSEYWSGDDKDAFEKGFTQTLQAMFDEEKRLNALAWSMGLYLKALKENESSTATDANRLGGVAV